MAVTSEWAEMVDVVRRWLARDVEPDVLRLEHADEYPTAMVEQMREFGLFGATIPAEYEALGMLAGAFAQRWWPRSPRLGCRSQERSRSGDRIVDAIRTTCSPRRAPRSVVHVDDLPRTRSGKLVELAVADIVNGRDVRNVASIANPGSLASIRTALDGPSGSAVESTAPT